MKNKITMILIACLFSMFQLTAQNKNCTKTISSSKDYIVEVIAFTFNVIQLTSNMNQSFEDVHSNIDYLEYNFVFDYKYSDTLVIVRYRCIEHSIILMFSRLEDTEQLKGCIIYYDNDKQIECLTEQLNKIAYRTYNAEYCWGVYSKKFNYFVLIKIDKKEKNIKFYLQ